MIIVTNQSNPLDIDYREGAVILVDKPSGWTSFDVVNKIRYHLKSFYGIKKIKVGHNGTLDPLATGLLMIFTGKYTKRIPLEENHDKRYDGIIKLGCTTVSLDAETEEIEFCKYDHIRKKDIALGVADFLGESQQEIPVYSATKVKGQRMYQLARKGVEQERKFKTVSFKSIEILSYEPPFISFDLVCGKGTYVRAFARDLGKKLGTAGYLYKLRRTQISEYKLDEAVEISSFCNHFNESS